jgi:hypothetical protein
MSRKAITVITLAAFVLTSASCVTWRTQTIAAASDAPGKRARIVSLVKASGERVEFSNSDPGRVRGDSITGTASARLSVPIDIQGPFSSIKKRADGTVYEITDGSGRVYPVQRVLKEGNTEWSILINDRTPQPVSIPLSDVRQIRFKKTNSFLTAIALGVPLTLGIYLYAMAKSLNE